MSLVFLDTNILLYSISDDPAEAPKRDRARELIDGGGCALSVQVLQEFYVQATRATRASPMERAMASAFVRSWLRFPVQETTVELIEAAWQIQQDHRFSYWDCAVIAAARALGCETLASEDMDHGRRIDGVTIRNPFRAL